MEWVLRVAASWSVTALVLVGVVWIMLFFIWLEGACVRLTCLCLFMHHCARSCVL